MSGPPIATAIVVDDAVTTLDRPMYRPDDALGMMSVISAQSTARNVPCDAPKTVAPTAAKGMLGATAMIATPVSPRAEQPEITGLRPMRSDSRDAGTIES